MPKLAASLCLVGALLACAAGARAESLDQVRRGFAQMVYEDAGPDINRGAPQPLLRAVVVLRVKLSDIGRWTAEVVRENDEQPELTRKALASVAHLHGSPEMSPAAAEQLRREGFMEVWLFQNDGRFALKTLALPQRGL
jgi:periplasmic protein TonB